MPQQCLQFLGLGAVRIGEVDFVVLPGEPAALPGRELTQLLDQVAALPHLSVEGLMTIGPWTDDRDAVRAAFRALARALAEERRRERPRAPLRELSMGMSGDFEIAIQEGATLVRVGSAIFGTRT